MPGQVAERLEAVFEDRPQAYVRPKLGPMALQCLGDVS